jgi:hypothetical protein
MRMRAAPEAASLMREGPLPAEAGAVLEVFGRVDVPIRKGSLNLARIQLLRG